MGFLFGGGTGGLNTNALKTCYKTDYEDTTKINFGAIFSSKISNLTVSEASISIVDIDTKKKPSLKSVAISTIINDIWHKMDIIVSRIGGEGGVVVSPYVVHNQIFFDIISQSRLTIYENRGNLITGAIAHTSNILDKNKNIVKKIYKNYILENGISYILKKEFNSSVSVEEIVDIKNWADADKEVAVTNAKTILLAYFKSPVDARNEEQMYGVPLIYGAKSIISEIYDCISQIQREYELKKSFIAVDEHFIDKKNKGLSESGIYQKIKNAPEDFFEIFDPMIRDSSYYTRLNELYRRLEKAVGVSNGIISSNPETYVNEVAIRRANSDTSVMIDKFRRVVTLGMQTILYIAEILYNITNPYESNSELTLNIDWYDPFEEPTAQFNRLLEGKAQSVVKAEELRQWLFPDETIEESRQIIEEIKQNDEFNFVPSIVGE